MVSKIKSIHNEQLKDNMMVKVTTAAACPVPREYTFKKVIWILELTVSKLGTLKDKKGEPATDMKKDRG